MQENLHYLTVGKNDLTQNLFCNKVLIISCNLLNTTLKVQNRMVVSLSVIYALDGAADWELIVWYHISLGWGKKSKLKI